MTHQRRLARLGLVLCLFVYAGLVHALILWWHWRLTGSVYVVVENRLDPVAFILLGAFWGAWWFYRPLQHAAQQSEQAFPRLLGRGMLYGILATVCAVLTLATVAAASFFRSPPAPLLPLIFNPYTGFFTAFFTWFVMALSFSGYGMGIVLFSAPIELAYGALAAAILHRTRNQWLSLEIRESTPPRKDQIALFLGIGGIVAFWFFPLATIASILAIFLGRDVRKANQQHGVIHGNIALAALWTGAAGLALQVVNLTRLLLAMHGR